MPSLAPPPINMDPREGHCYDGDPGKTDHTRTTSITQQQRVTARGESRETGFRRSAERSKKGPKRNDISERGI